MKRIALLLALLLVSTVVLAQDREAEKKHLLEVVRTTRSAFAKIGRCEDFLDRFPDSPEALHVLRTLLQHSSRTLETRQKALDLLRRAEREHPGWREGLGSVYGGIIESLAGWKFTPIPALVRPSRKRRIQCSDLESGAPEREFRVWFVTGEAERRALFSADLDRVSRVLPPREEWEAVAGWKVAVEGDRGAAPALSKPGTWIVEEEVSGLTNTTRVAARTWLILARGSGPDGVVWVFDPRSRESFEGVKITVRQKDGLTEGTTRRNGTFRFRRTSNAVVSAERGDEVQGATLWYDPPEEGDESKILVHVTTDRPVYRPGHEVRFRAVRRDLECEALSIPKTDTVRVDLRDPQGRLVSSRTASWDADGVISGSFTLTEEPPLGQWILVVNERDPWYREYPGEWNQPEDVTNRWRRPFRVEEYRKPEIRVSFETADAAEDGRPRGRVRVEYYTGEPAAGAGVEWWAEARHPDEESGPSELKTHPLGWFFLRPSRFRWEWDEREHWGSAEGGRGEGKTGADGTLLVDFLPEEGEVDPGAEDAEEFIVHAIVTGITRMGVETSGTVPVSGSGERLSLDISAMWIDPGETLVGRVVVRDSAGSPVAGRKVEVIGLEMNVRSGEEEFEEYVRQDLVTGEDGASPFRLEVPRTGRIRVRARCRTARDGARHDVVVASPRCLDLPWRRGAEDAPFELLPDRVVYEPGDTARILVRQRRRSCRSVRALLLVETEGIRSVETVLLPESLPVLEVPITADLAPNATVTLLAGRNEKIFVASFELLVFPGERMLTVRATPEREEYAPGDRVRIRVDTHDSAGDPVPAVVELAVVDESIFAVAKDRTEDLRSFFFPFPWRDDETELPPLKWNRIHGSWRSEFLDEDQPQFGSAEEGEATFTGAGGGNAATSIRRAFADTMHYDAHVRTGEDGTARVEIDAPDNLAEWRIVARAVSGADRFGVATSRTVTRKDVTVRISAPRFFTVRDVGVLGTVVRNDVPEETEFTVQLTAEGIEIRGEPRTVRIAAGGETAIDWPYRVSQAGTARLRAKALSTAMSDATEIEVPVLPHGALQQVTAAGRIDGTWRASLTLPPDADRESARLVVHASSLASSLKDALPFLAGYPYGCVEQTMSRFLPSVVAARTLARLGMRDPALEAELPKMVDRGLGKLYRDQHVDGGWGWWEHDETHPFMTAYVVYGLLTAREAGSAVDARTIERGVEALLDMETESPTAFGRSVLTRGEADLADLPDIEPGTVEDRAWLTLAGRRGLLASYRPPRNRDTGAAVREAALALRALHAEDPADRRISELAVWLLTRRRGRAWHSTLDSAYAVLALAEVAEPSGTVSVRVRVNGRELEATDGRLVVPATALVAGENTVVATHEGVGVLFGSAALRFRNTAAENLAPLEGRFIVKRVFERSVRDEDGDRDWEPIESGEAVTSGEELRVVLDIEALGSSEYVMIESPLPAGAEAWPDEEDEEWWLDAWYQRRELRDDRVAVAAREIEGREIFTFRLRTTLPGTYHVMPARAFSMYEPDESGRSAEFILRVVR